MQTRSMTRGIIESPQTSNTVSPVDDAPVTPAAESLLLSLPWEIRNMIYEQYYTLLADPDEGCVELRDSYWIPEPRPGIFWYKNRGGYGSLPGLLNLFLVSKQVSREAQEVFWTTTIFKCESPTSFERFLGMKRQGGKRRTQLYPTKLLRHIKVKFGLDYIDTISVNRLQLVQYLWTIAKSTSKTLSFEIDSHSIWCEKRLHLFGYDIVNKTSTYPAMLDQVREYQARCKDAGISLRVPKKEMRTWIEEGRVFALELPPVPPKVALKKRETPAKKSSSSRSLELAPYMNDLFNH